MISTTNQVIPNIKEELATNNTVESPNISSTFTQETSITTETSTIDSIETKIIVQPTTRKKSKKFSKLINLNEILNGLLLSSTAVVLVKLIRHKSIIFKLFWLMTILVLSSGCVLFSIRHIIDYLNYEVVSKIDTIYENKAYFPTISFCNTAKFNQSISFKERLLYCQFDSDTDCFINENKYFESYNDSIYGTCYRFNSKKNGSILKSSASGIAYGFKMNLLIEEKTGYDFGELAFFIHNNSFYNLNLFNREYYLSTGTFNIISISRVFQNKLPEPYTNCLDDLSKFKTKTC